MIDKSKDDRHNEGRAINAINKEEIMDNNDILIRIRYALDIKDKDMLKIFKFGELDYTNEELGKILTKSKEVGYFHDDVTDEEIEKLQDNIPCTNEMLERFLNGFIIFKRGVQELKPGQTPPPRTIVTDENVNNVLLKKLKIALSLSGDEILNTFELGGAHIGKSELGGIMRKEGHKNYRPCGDNFARKFLKGLSRTYRK